MDDMEHVEDFLYQEICICSDNTYFLLRNVAVIG